MHLTVKEVEDHDGGMSEAPVDNPDDVVIPALLRSARGSYGNAIRISLAKAGYDDLPRNGAFVLGGLVNRSAPSDGLVRALGVSKQAASQLIDTLVLRGYLERSENPDDRRRISIEPTERGRAAAAAIREGVLSVDAELASMITPEQLAAMREGLFALVGIRERLDEQLAAGAL
jgi:DNA-binding MarR family transcriptional regulator